MIDIFIPIFKRYPIEYKKLLLTHIQILKISNILLCLMKRHFINTNFSFEEDKPVLFLALFLIFYEIPFDS